MKHNIFNVSAAVVMSISTITGFTPVLQTEASTKSISAVQAKLTGSAPFTGTQKSRSVRVTGAGAQFSGKYTASFLDKVRSGNNRLSYSGSLADAKASLNELVSFYCSLGYNIQYYDCKDASGTYLEITDQYWSVLRNAVSRADNGWKSYENFVANACWSLNLNASDRDLVNQINNYICKNFDYRVTNAGMPNFIDTRTGQCWHYSKLFTDMCNAVGISAKKVENKDHAWNEVIVDGVTYTFDVTYNDTGNNWSAYSWLNPSKKAGAATTGISSGSKNTWIKSNGCWQYIGSSGSIVKSSWIKSGNKWYYVNKSGNMMTSSWLQTGGKWYYLKSDGSMATDTWIDGCYVDKNGVWVQ